MAFTNEQILSDLEAIFRDVLDDNSIRLDTNITANDVADWDSVNHLVLLHAIEQKYGIKFDLNEMIGFRNVGDISACIVLKLSN